MDKVVALDKDTSQQVKDIRTFYADDLEQYYEQNIGDSIANKALLYAYYIKLRNKAYQQIIDDFGQLYLEQEQFDAMFPLVYTSLKNLYDWEVIMQKLEKVAASADICTYCKITIYRKIGQIYFYKDRKKEAEKFFALIVEKENEFLTTMPYIEEAKSFLRQMQLLQVGQKALDFSSKDINGIPVLFKDKKDKVILLDFWATWCGHCVKELPVLKELYADYGHRNDFEIISISLDKKRSNLESFIEKEQMTWTHIHEPKGRKGELPLLYNGVALPTYIVIDQDGIIQYNYDSREEGQSLKETVERLLQK